MTELTDRMIRDRMKDTEFRSAYHLDPSFHAALTSYGYALDAAHRALVADGSPEADRIVEVLSLGWPELELARHNIEAAHKLIWGTS